MCHVHNLSALPANKNNFGKSYMPSSKPQLKVPDLFYFQKPMHACKLHKIIEILTHHLKVITSESTSFVFKNHCTRYSVYDAWMSTMHKEEVLHTLMTRSLLLPLFLEIKKRIIWQQNYFVSMLWLHIMNYFIIISWPMIKSFIFCK